MLARYMGTSAAYGFVRGWKADYDYNKYDRENPIRPLKYTLETERFAEKLARGCMNASMYGTVGNPFALFRLMSRIEIAATGKDPYDHISAYSEALNYTTLPPRVQKTFDSP